MAKKISRYEKGWETAYGFEGSSDALLKKFGVMIRKQNGSEFLPDEISFLSAAISNVWKFFGGLKSFAKSRGLVISFSSGRGQFGGSHAPGICIFNGETNRFVIGVSALKNKPSYLPLDLILAHETAHWLDAELGKKLIRREVGDDFLSPCMSDVFGSYEYWAALQYKLMLWPKKRRDIQEYFATAIEEFYAVKNCLADFCHRECYVPKDKFLRVVSPECERYMKSLSRRLREGGNGRQGN